MKEIEKQVRSLLDKAQVSYQISMTGGSHKQVVLRVGEEARTVFFPHTPSSPRAIPNTKAKLKRTLREMSGVEQVVTTEPTERPRRKYRAKVKPTSPRISERLRAKEPPPRTFQVPAPLEAHQRDVTAMKLYRYKTSDSASDPMTNEEKARVAKIEANLDELTELVRELNRRLKRMERDTTSLPMDMNGSKSVTVRNPDPRAKHKTPEFRAMMSEKIKVIHQKRKEAAKKAKAKEEMVMAAEKAAKAAEHKPVQKYKVATEYKPDREYKRTPEQRARMAEGQRKRWAKIGKVNRKTFSRRGGLLT